jgi:hypothetical protein
VFLGTLLILHKGRLFSDLLTTFGKFEAKSSLNGQAKNFFYIQVFCVLSLASISALMFSIS